MKDVANPLTVFIQTVTYHHEVASILLGEVNRESCSVAAYEGPTDELHPFTKSSETGLG